MAEPEERPPTVDEIAELRKRTTAFIAENGEDSVDPADLKRIMNDNEYISRYFLHCTDIPGDHIKNTEDMIIRSLKFRKEKEVRAIRSKDLEESLKTKGALYLRNRDSNGKQMLVFDVKKHTKGVANMTDMQRMFLYFLERVDREDPDGMVTIVFDCAGCGLRNMDMDFIRYMIDVLKDYYPYVLNYILVFEMPWVLNAAWKIIQAWLPAAAVRKIKFVKKNNIGEFVKPDQRFVTWGGEDPWEYEFVEEEEEESYEAVDVVNGDHSQVNGFSSDSSDKSSPLVEVIEKQSVIQNNHEHLESRASMISTTSISFLEDNQNNNSELEISPKDELVFVKGAKGLMATISITSRIPTLIAFKVKTTSPERYRVRPSIGLVSTSGTTKIEVYYQPINPENDDYSDVLKDKFLINLFKPTTQDWKKEIKDAKPYQHQRLKASVKKSLLKTSEKKEIPNGLSNTVPERDVYLKELKALERSNQAIRDELKSTLFYARLTLFMTVIVAFLVIILPYFNMTIGCSPAETEDTFPIESNVTPAVPNHEL